MQRQHPTDEDLLEDRFPDLHWPHTNSTNPIHAQRKLMLELALLSGMTDDEIATACGYSKEIVGAYEAVFYNVRRLLHTPYGVPLYLTAGIDPNDRALEPSRLWRLAAYYRGFNYVATILNRFEHKDHPSSGMVMSALTDDVIAGLKYQTFVAIQMASTRGQGASEMVSNFVKNRDVESREDLNDTSTDQLAIALKVLERTVSKHVTIGDYDPATGSSVTPLPPLVINGAVEPQVSATLRPDVMRRLETAQYPNMVPAAATT